MRRPARPFGVTAIVVLQLLSGVSMLILVVTTLRRAAGDGSLGIPPTLVGILALVPDTAPLLVEGLADLVSAAGLLLLRRWAWVLVMLLVGYSMSRDLWQYASGGEAMYEDMLLSVLAVFYLNQREVQRVFRHGGAADPREGMPVQRAR